MKKLLYFLLFVPFTFLGQNTAYVEQDIPLELQEGWSIFGYSCVEPIDATEALEPIIDNVVIVKDYQGNAYLPTWNFNGIGNLEYSKGYQIKLLQEIIGFQFCAAIIPDINNEIIFGCTYPIAINFFPDAIQDDGSCEFEIDYWVDVIFGCTDAVATNYNEEATEDDGSCEYFSILYGCTDENACNYNEAVSIENGSCYYSEYEYCIGDIYQGGYVFKINDDGTGLVADIYDIECYVNGEYMSGLVDCGYTGGNSFQISGWDAVEAASNLVSQGYNDWYLPNIDELEEMSQNIGPLSELYLVSATLRWSSTEYNSAYRYLLDFSSGGITYYGNNQTLMVRAIRSFGEINDTTQACPYDVYLEYNPDATIYNAELCQTLIIEGCMDSIAVNYNMEANTDAGNCQYILGCTDLSADNYNPEATQDDENCIYYGCMDVMAGNYNQQANQEDNSCIYFGCMNPTADNYDPQANEDDGSCIIYGCTLADFPNYNSEATVDDFSCDMSSADVFGCTDPSYLEYDPIVNHDNGTCSVFVVYGCTDNLTCNYNPEANTDDGSCIYPELGYDCDGNQLPAIGDLINGGIVFYIDETGEHGLVAAMEDLGQFEWGCYGTDINGINSSVSPELDGIGTGLQNTLEIVSGCSATPIAASEALAYESEGYSDWYLPSRYELVEMYNTIGNGGPEGNIGGFSNSWYWSSSEIHNNRAWTTSFTDGWPGSYYKSSTGRVRIIRAF